MESDLGRLSVQAISEKELSRQFRVLRQTLSMHTMLRDRYTRLALIIDILFLACSVTFCATTFARGDVFAQIGLSLKNIRFILGVASIVAFFASLVALRVDWKGKAARHRDAVQKLTNVLSLFRARQQEDGSWPEDRSTDLHRTYWEAMNNIIEVPDRPFVRLKVRYLRKVELSKMSDSASGCPLFVLRLILLIRSTLKAFRKIRETGKEPIDETEREDSRQTEQDR